MPDFTCQPLGKLFAVWCGMATKISDLNHEAESHITEQYFGDNTHTVRMYAAALKSIVGGDGALYGDIEQVVAGNRRVRSRIIDDATYWVARWRRFDAIC